MAFRPWVSGDLQALAFGLRWFQSSAWPDVHVAKTGMGLSMLVSS